MSMLKKLGAASAAILKTIMGPQVGKNDICDAIGYTTNAGAPSSVVPDFIGQKLFDTTGSQFYIAYGTASGEWSPMGDNSLSATELAYLDGALTTNAVADKAAIIGTGGALTFSLIVSTSPTAAPPAAASCPARALASATAFWRACSSSFC